MGIINTGWTPFHGKYLPEPNTVPKYDENNCLHTDIPLDGTEQDNCVPNVKYLEKFYPNKNEVQYNKNLLRNWDLRNPINSEGYIYGQLKGYQYSINNWILTGRLTRTNNGISLVSNIKQMVLTQMFYKDEINFTNQTLTFSAHIITEPTIRLGISLVIDDSNIIKKEIIDGNVSGIFSVTATIPEYNKSVHCLIDYWGDSTPVDTPLCDIKYTKLEYGEISTLHYEYQSDYVQQRQLCENYSNGKLITDTGTYSANIAINGDFRTPINQQGQSVYSIMYGSKYTIDCWKLSATGRITGKMSILYDSYIQLEGISSDTAEKPLVHLWQYLENCSPLKNSPVTLSIYAKLLNSAQVSIYIFNETKGQGSEAVNIYQTSDFHLFQLKINPKSLWEATDKIRLTICGESNFNIQIKWFKLEYGEKYTGFKSLDMSTELLRCSRYFVKCLSTSNVGDMIGISQAIISSFAYVYISTPVPIRTRPSVRYTGEWRLVGLSSTGDPVEIDVIPAHIVEYGPGHVILRVDAPTNNLIPSNMYTLKQKNLGLVPTDIYLDANL